MLREKLRGWGWVLLVGPCIGLATVACGAADEADPKPGGEDPPAVRARFQLDPAPLPWGAVPWPDDLYLEDGSISVTALPFESDALAEEMARALAALDGAATRPTIVVAFDGELDAASLPATPADTLLPAASVFLIDADASSPDAFERVPLEVALARDRRSIHARVAFDRALTPGRRYALVVTDALRARLGNRRVGAAEAFARVLDVRVPVADAREQRARAQYASILPALEDDGVARGRVVAMASFRVQSTERDLDAARTFIAGEPPAPARVDGLTQADELDGLLGAVPSGELGAVLGAGVAHQHLAALVHLSVETPMFADVTEGRRTALEHDRGKPVPRGRHGVPCSLTVPRSASGAPLPVVLFQHGLFKERSDALPLANELAAAGQAVLTCDAPLHGSRLAGADVGNRFTGAAEPDGFGDRLGDVLGEDDGAGELPAAHPFYYRDAVQQAVVDWLAIVHALRAGAWDELLREALGRSALTLDRDNLGFVGVDLGAEIGVALCSREAEVRAAVLAFAGGRTLDDWLEGPDYAPLRAPFEPLAADHDDERLAPAFQADIDVVRALLDAASGLGHAERLRRSRTNLLGYIAVEDELIPQRSSEALAYAVGAALIDAAPQHELELRRDLALPGSAISGNFPLSRGAVTRAAQSLSPSTHAALFESTGFLRYEHPLQREPALLAAPRRVSNRTAAVLRQIVFFFESHRACRASEPDPQVPCPAAVIPLGTAS